MKVDERKHRLLRFPPDIDEVLVGYAREHDLTINEAAVEAIQRLGSWTPPAKTQTPPEPAVPVENGMIHCPHPRPSLTQVSYGTICDKKLGGCGRLIRR